MDKEQTAIARLQEAARTSERYYKKPLIVMTSGGKDSSVCVELALRAGIDFELMHNHTTADAPETVRFLRSEFKRLEDMGFPSDQIIINYPIYKGLRTSMWNLIPQKLMPPTRVVRYCCSILKERGGQGRYITTGVRWAESAKRQKRGVYENVERDQSKKSFLITTMMIAGGYSRRAPSSTRLSAIRLLTGQMMMFTSLSRTQRYH